jgi:hypothetical protein
MSIELGKKYQCCIVLNDQVFERVNSMTDWGVILDSEVSFREHIDSVVYVQRFGFMNKIVWNIIQKRISHYGNVPKKCAASVVIVDYSSSKATGEATVFFSFKITHIPSTSKGTLLKKMGWV